MYSDIAIAVSASILASMLVAITLIPTAAARLDFGAGNKRAPNPRVQAWRDKLLERIGWLIGDQRRRWICVGTTVAASVLIILVLTPPAEYLPEGEEAKTFASMNAPPGYNLETMSKIGKEIQAYFLPHVGASVKAYENGETDIPPFKYLNLRISPQSVRIIAEPVKRGHMEALMDAITGKYETYPGMRAFATRGSIITSNDAGTRSVDVDISGSRLDAIYDVALAAYRRADEVFDNPRVQTNPSSLSLAQPLVEVRPDWDRAAELGMAAGGIGYSVAALTDGAYVDEFFMADDKIDMYPYSTAGTTATLDSLDKLPIHTPQGAVVPLSSLATITETVDTSEVRRVNGRRTVTLNIIPPRSVPLEIGVERVRNDIIEHLRQTGQMPADVAVDISGAADQLDATREALGQNYLVALVIVYLLLVAIFVHWGYPLLIMTTIPLGIAGGIAGLWLMNATADLANLLGFKAMHQPFDMISMLGFLILMGTVVNNPILIVHRAIANVREAGVSAVEAVREAVDSRLRPIVMSTITTICGLSPLVFLPGAGTELYRGVGIIVLAGLLGTAIVALTMLPALTVIVLSWTNRQTASDSTAGRV